MITSVEKCQKKAWCSEDIGLREEQSHRINLRKFSVACLSNFERDVSQ